MSLKKPSLAQIKDPNDLLSLLVDYYDALVELDGKRSPSKLPGLKAITAATIAGLRKTTGDDTGEAGPRVALLSGGASVLDGLEGAFAWDSTSTTADDSSSVINPNGAKPGRWQRMVWSGVNLALALFTSTTSGIVPASGGGTANFLRADGSWSAPPVPASGGRLLRSPRILTSGTSVASTAGCLFAIAEVWAGGGQGGGCTASLGDSGEGGASGGYAYFATSTIPVNWSYAIGAGGSAGGNGAAGFAGGNSTFSDGVTTVTAFGGPGGGLVSSHALPGAAPAISTNGTINGSGVPGTPSCLNALATRSGSGGASVWGGAGLGRASDTGTDQNGANATSWASGGGGAMAGAGAAPKAGGQGFSGIIRLWEFS